MIKKQENEAQTVETMSDNGRSIGLSYLNDRV